MPEAVYILVLALLHSLWQGALVYGLYRSMGRPSRYMYGMVAALPLLFLATLVWLLSSGVDQETLTSGMANPVAASGWWLGLAAIWLSGVTIQTGRHVRAYFGIRRLREQGDILTKGPLFETLQKLSHQLGLRREVSLRLSHVIDIPMVVGCFKPVVLFPISLVNQLPPEEVEAILCHELQHVVKHDYLWNLAMVLSEVIFFFNPFVHLLHRSVREAREIRCDLQAAELTGRPVALAQALVRIEGLLHEKKMALSLRGTGSLTKRIYALTGNTLPQSNNTNIMSYLLTISMAVLPWVFSGELAETYEASIPSFSIDSIALPGYDKKVHTLEYKTVMGEIKEVRVNNEDVITLSPEQTSSLRRETDASTTTSTNLRDAYQTGLLKKFERKHTVQLKSQIPVLEDEVTMVEGPDLAMIDGYQYGKSFSDREFAEVNLIPNLLKEAIAQNRQSEVFLFKADPLILEEGQISEFEESQEMWYWLSSLQSYVDTYEVEFGLIALLEDMDLISNVAFKIHMTPDGLQVDGKKMEDEVHHVLKTYIELERPDRLNADYTYLITKTQLR